MPTFVSGNPATTEVPGAVRSATETGAVGSPRYHSPRQAGSRPSSGVPFAVRWAGTPRNLYGRDGTIGHMTGNMVGTGRVDQADRADGRRRRVDVTAHKTGTALPSKLPLGQLHEHSHRGDYRPRRALHNSSPQTHWDCGCVASNSSR